MGRVQDIQQPREIEKESENQIAREKIPHESESKKTNKQKSEIDDKEQERQEERQRERGA